MSKTPKTAPTQEVLPPVQEPEVASPARSPESVRIEQLSDQLSQQQALSANYQQQLAQYAQNNLILEKQVAILRQRLLKASDEILDAEVRVALLQDQVNASQKHHAHPQ
jgi:hypothetical protein